jgi:uroporphyrinogen-III synthase
VEKILKHKKVLLTRPVDGIEEFQRKLNFEGAEVIAQPLIQLSLKADQSEMNAALDALGSYDWLVFTSPAAVKFFFQRVQEKGMKMYFYPELKIATVGEKTKMKLEQLGYRTNFVPIQFTAEVLAENLPDVEEKNILIPASSLSKQDYIKAFQKRGAIPHQIMLYENLKRDLSQEEQEQIKAEPLDYLTFTSGSAIKAFNEYFGNPADHFSTSKVICIGHSTSKVAQELNWKVDAIADPHTVEGMIEVMKKLEKQ